MANKVMEVKNLKKYFPINKGFFGKPKDYVKAVDDVSFFVKEGETLGLVGESGCGKTTLGRCIVKAIDSTAGEIIYHSLGGKEYDIAKLQGKELRSLRKEIQMVFQDPYASLDPRMTVYDIIAEPLKVNFDPNEFDFDERIKELAKIVGLNIEHLKRYPHAFSGGQRQRIGIARALTTYPRLIVADESVSALDVSVQAQVLNLLKKLQQQMNLTYIFIAHDLSVVHHISDRVAVMYVGQTVELAKTQDLFSKPLHPYTEALISAVPMPDPRNKMERIILEGEVPNPANPPNGCYFHPRCPYAKENNRMAKCSEIKPEFVEVEKDHFVACHYAKELKLKSV